MKNETQNAELEKRPCKCCGVFHDPNLCAQCQVAGCAAKGKKEKCRLQGTLVEARTLSKFQLEALVVELKKQNAELLAEAQRLARLVFEAEAKKAAA